MHDSSFGCADVVQLDLYRNESHILIYLRNFRRIFELSEENVELSIKRLLITFEETELEDV